MTDTQRNKRPARRPDCVTETRIGNTILVVSGFFKEGATDTAADKMMKVLEAEAAAILSPAAKKCGFKDKGYLCYEEDAQESVVLRELLDKKLWHIPERIKDREKFEETINQSIRRYNPDYWRARQSGLEHAKMVRRQSPAKEAVR